MALLNSTFVLTARLGEYDINMFHYNCMSLEEALSQFWHNDYPEHLIEHDSNTLFPIDIICMPDEDGQVERTLHLMFNCVAFNHFFDKGWSASSQEPDKRYTLDQFLKDIDRKPEKQNDITSFMFYMWNAWCEEECQEAFKDGDWKHFWSKWCHWCNQIGSAWGATERFYSELSDHNRDRLVRRALAIYEGRHDKRNVHAPHAESPADTKTNISEQ